MAWQGDGVVDFTEFCKALCIFPEQDADQLVKASRRVYSDDDVSAPYYTQLGIRSPGVTSKFLRPACDWVSLT
eukprot:scaffold109916_cov16-Prasinocladus_malaysianus.AAC.1